MVSQNAQTREERMTHSSDRIEADAALWLVRVDSAGSPEKWVALDAWLAANPRHRAAFLRLSAGWRRAEQLRNLKAFDGSVDVNLLSPRAVREWQAASRPSKWRLTWSFALKAATAAAVLVLGIYWVAPLALERLGTQVYATQLGEHRHIQLPDGSTVDLNTDSELRVRLTDERRRVMLARGEAAFKVTHNPKRPFDVQAGRNVVRVLGTAFSVRLRDEARVDVRVTEGRVAISPPPLLAVLTPGDTAVIASGRVAITQERVDILARRLMWTDGRLFFNGETLAEAVGEFNRYNHRSLVITDPKIAGLRISGTFQARDPEGFMTSVKALPAARGTGATIRLNGKDP
jgi:transmembrane sensor